MNTQLSLKYKRIFMHAFMVGLLGQLYVMLDPAEPFFVTIFGVALLGYFILHMQDIQEYLILPIVSGLFVVAFRMIFDFIFHLAPNTIVLAETAFVYYLCYGILAVLLLPLVKSFKSSHKREYLILSIGMLDFFSNMVERFFFSDDLHISIQELIIIAIIRSFLIWAFDLIMERQRMLTIREEHEKRYARLNDFLVNIYSEVFYLKKSQADLEHAMKEAHRIYDESQNPDALNLAIAIHEIKKDYYRLVSGLSNLVDNVDDNHRMSVRDIFAIIEENMEHQKKDSGKDITLNFICYKDGIIDQCYDIFIVVNNLIVNAMDACGEKGRILVTYESNGDYDIFTVIDNGSGMEEEVKECIFLPGFSTKFDPHTGEMSSGIGLCHVKDVVTKRGGDILCTSQIGKGTEFVISFPKTI
ncbi:MAG: sensor histidine kinase [Lachnospiraceae bacterium]|nr:sensor histidine kinase [Lachnospiraceae bacterium]